MTQNPFEGVVEAEQAARVTVGECEVEGLCLVTSCAVIPHRDLEKADRNRLLKNPREAGLAADDRLRHALHDYFAWATTTSMAQYHESADDVPDGLRMPRWSWDGMVTEDRARH